ncbi:MAG: type I restriction-modification system subunit M N-terminal domain-containing protein, partial [Candidatus Kryptoniota bacterium]
MADALRGSMDAAEYKHVVLGLIFLKYISDAFEERYALLEAEKSKGADPEDPDEYRAQNIFWVPPEARWAKLQAQARQPTIGQLVDSAMAVIERDNPPFNVSDWGGEILFIRAHKPGRMVGRTDRELTDEDFRRIADTNHAWRGEPGPGEYRDVPAFYKSTKLEEIRQHGYVLTPGWYVGAPEQEEDDEPFAERMAHLVNELKAQQA